MSVLERDSFPRIDESAIADLRARMRGPVIAPQQQGYDDSRSVWNAMIDRRPALIARCLGTADVIEGIGFAREHGLPLAIKGGGHNISGLAVCDAGLQLDMSSMRGVWVNEPTLSATVQAGCLLGDIDRETQVHGLAAPLGFVSNTGVAGLTLGGGFGYLARRFGWTSDNVESADVVTADGRLVHASEHENDDLFWGLRGGGGNFGVVTHFRFRLQPIGPEVVAGAIAWPAEDADAVFDMYAAIARDAPPELSCTLAMRPAPPAPWLPKETHGKPIVAMFVCHSGPVQEGEADVRPIKAFGTPVGDVVQRRTYVSQQSLVDATQPKGRRYYWKSEYLPRLDRALLEKIAEHASRVRSPHSMILIFPIGGALEKLPLGHSAVGNRDAAFVLNITGSWERPEDDEINIEWARAAWRDMRSFSTGGTYINFLTQEEGDERIRTAYGDNYARLIEIKRKWDPRNVFRVNKNIVP